MNGIFQILIDNIILVMRLEWRRDSSVD